MAAQPATAYAPGSPTSDGGGGIAQRAAGALLGAMGLGGGAAPGIGIGVGSTTTSGSGDAMQGGSGTGDDFAVNFGRGVTQGGSVLGGGGLGAWVLPAAIVLAAFMLFGGKKQ